MQSPRNAVANACQSQIQIQTQTYHRLLLLSKIPYQTLSRPTLPLPSPGKTHLPSSSSSSQWFSLLRQAISSSNLHLDKSIHARILTSSEYPDRFLINNLITMYARCGSLLYARRVFDKMPDRDLISWNSILAAYAHSGEYDVENVKEGFCLFRLLRESVVLTSRLTLRPVLKLTLASGFVWASEAVHGYVVKICLDWDVFFFRVSGQYLFEVWEN